METLDPTQPAEIDITGIRARAEAATPGPWIVEPSEYSVDIAQPDDVENALIVCSIDKVTPWDADANFIASARKDVPALLAAYEAEKARADALQAIVSGAIALVALERRRQIDVEGWTAEHDDQHVDGGTYGRPALPEAAAVYAVTAHMGPQAVLGCQNPGWPFDAEWFKPASPIRMLVKAGALICAEIDRRLRTGEQP